MLAAIASQLRPQNLRINHRKTNVDYTGAVAVRAGHGDINTSTNTWTRALHGYAYLFGRTLLMLHFMAHKTQAILFAKFRCRRSRNTSVHCVSTLCPHRTAVQASSLWQVVCYRFLCEIIVLACGRADVRYTLSTVCTYLFDNNFRIFSMAKTN